MSLARIVELFERIFSPKTHIFHDSVINANVPNGNVYNNMTDSRKTITFDIAGSSTSQVYEFRTIGPAGNDNLTTCYSTIDSNGATGTNARGGTWQVTVEGLSSFYVKLISIDGGTGIVKGNIT